MGKAPHHKNLPAKADHESIHFLFEVTDSIKSEINYATVINPQKAE